MILLIFGIDELTLSMQMQKKWNDSRNVKPKLLIYTQNLVKLAWPFWQMTPMNFCVNKELL